MAVEIIKQKSKYQSGKIIAGVLAFVLFLALTCDISSADKTLAQKVRQAQEEIEFVDFAMGDYQGIWVSDDGTISPLVAQVIALGERKYRANFYEEFNKPGRPIASLQGGPKEPMDPELPDIVFKGSSDSGDYSGTEWQGIIDGSREFTGSLKGQKQGSFEMRRTFRLSPTLGAEPPAGAIVLFDGTNLDQWEHPFGTLGFVNLGEIIGGENCAAYLRSRIWSDRQQHAVLGVSSDDAIKVWLNGRLILAENLRRPIHRLEGQDKLDVTLKQGWNELMLKVVNYTDYWGAIARFVVQKEFHVFDYDQLEGIGEEDLDSLTERGTRKYLDQNHDYLTVWQVSGPYRQEGKTGEEIFDVAFAPEKPGAKNVSWRPIERSHFETKQAQWKIVNGAMEILPGSTPIITKQKFDDFKLHIEFRIPFLPRDSIVGPGNSGVLPQGRYELQVVDTYGLPPSEGGCGGILGTGPPRVNMCLPPMQWQTYDVTFHAPRFDQSGRKTKHARMTVVQNGVKIHDNQEIQRPAGGILDRNITEPAGLCLQDHGYRVQFANIWLVELQDQ